MNVVLFVRIVVPNSISFLTDDDGSGNDVFDWTMCPKLQFVVADDGSTFRFFAT